MYVLIGEKLAQTVRAAMDKATHRAWVAAPFVGPWGSGIRRVLGVSWRTAARDVRLLTDVTAGRASRKTLELFSSLGAVRSLTGLHAKLYIADDTVILTSANLSQMAFERRYEVGVRLRSADRQAAVVVFEQWWKKAKPVDPAKVKFTAPTWDPEADGHGPSLEVLWDPNQDPGDSQPDGETRFRDWEYFVEQFDDLAHRYVAIQRLWPNQPLYFEVDALLDFLYHHQAKRISRKYTTRKPRRLSTSERNQEIRKYARQFRTWYESEDNDVEGPTWRREHSRTVQRLLTIASRRNLTKTETRTLLRQTNALHSYPINIRKVLNSRNNSKGAIRNALITLADPAIPIQRRLRDASTTVFGLGRAAVQELVAFNEPGKYPFRNGNSNAGLRFFGYDVKPS